MQIGISGKLRSGKDTVSDIFINLAKNNGIDMIKKSLAMPIYKIAKDFYKKYDLIWNPNKKNRRLLEGIGSALNDDTKDGKDKIIELFNKDYTKTENFITNDIRRLTQANYFKNKNIPLIRVECNEEIRKSRCKPGEFAKGHITDLELDNYSFDYIIENNGNLQQLEQQCIVIFNDIYKKGK